MTQKKPLASITVNKDTRDRLNRAKREISFDRDTDISLDRAIGIALDALVAAGVITPYEEDTAPDATAVAS